MKDTVFESLIRAIISQQLSTKVATVIRERFLQLLKISSSEKIEEIVYLEQILNLKDEDMRAVGLSKQKIKYIKNVAQFFKDKNLYKLKKEDWGKKSDEEIVTLLTEIVGIGEWTVQMILIFKLERKDVFPINDLGVQVGFAKMFDLEEFRINNKKEFLKKMLEEAEKEKPYRSDFAKSLWKVKDSK